jgi:hypothetical protein
MIAILTVGVVRSERANRLSGEPVQPLSFRGVNGLKKALRRGIG